MIRQGRGRGNRPYAIVPPVPPDAPPLPANDIAPADAAAARVVFGAFRTTGDLDRALARLAAVRPPAVVAVEACDAAAARIAHRRDQGAPRLLIVALAGAMEAVALGHRQVWQAIEGAAGVPANGDAATAAADAAAARGPSGAALGPGTTVRVVLPEDALTVLLDWAAEVGGAAHGVAARVWPGTGEGWIFVPAPGAAEAPLAWLRRQVAARGGRMAVAAAAAAGS